MANLQVSYFSPSGEPKGSIDLPAFFQDEGSRRVLHEVIVAFQANQRRGTSSTKTRGNVRGGGRKPWKQKGTGNARSGSIRSPLWRKGGIIFGPLPRSYRIDVPEGKRAIALQTALAAKAKSSELSVIDVVAAESKKTRDLRQVLKKTKLEGQMLLVVDKKSEDLLRAARNIADLTIRDAAELNAFELLRPRRVLLTKAALEALERRFPKN